MKPRWTAVDRRDSQRQHGQPGVKAPSTATIGLPKQTHGELDCRQRWLESHDGFDESEQSIRMRVRQQIQHRVQELQAASGRDHDPPVAFCGDEHAFEGKHRVIESLHEDVVLTAAQILERYLEKNQRDDSLELTLVHRMLVKEVELQALQRQRETQQSKPSHSQQKESIHQHG